MTAEREMTLHEWVGKLPEIHLARKELVAMQERIAALEAEDIKREAWYQAAVKRIAELELDRELIAGCLMNDPPFDMYGVVDLHEEASINASAFCREEPNANDYYAAFLTCIKQEKGNE